MPLNGRTIDEAARWLRAQLAECGLDAAAFTLNEHFTIPPHPVGATAAFDTAVPARFDELARWYSDASLVLEQVVAFTPNASPVRCWPHHFDIATLIEVAAAAEGSPAKTINVGMEPGDDSYAEPYVYVSMYPSPSAGVPRPSLAGDGHWHTEGWLGAVLPGSRIAATEQQAQVEAFVSSAVSACVGLLRGSNS